MITLAVMSATLIQVLDTTIVNVALPHMQGELGATADQISWVLTSYLVSSAIFMPLTGHFTDVMGPQAFPADLHRGIRGRFGAVRHFAERSRRSCCSGCCRESSARRWCRCRRPSWPTPIHRRNAARPWPSGDWA